MRRLAILLVLLRALGGECERRRPARPPGTPISRRRRPATPNTPDGAQARYEAGRNLVEAVLAAGPGQLPTVARCAPTCSPAAGPRSRERRGSTAVTASAALAPLAPLPGRERRCRPASSGCRPRATPGSGRREGRRRRRDLGPRARLRALRRLSGGLAASRPPPRSRSARWSRGCATRRIPNAAGGGTTCARSASGRRTLPRTGSPAGSATARSRDGLRRLGMTSSTYPGPYRATTAWRPPGAHTRVTTARDLGRALYRLHAGAHGDARVLRLLGLTRRQAVAALRVLASAQPVGDNAGLLQPWLGGVDRRPEERLALRHAHDRGDRLPGRQRDDRRRRGLPPGRDLRRGEAARP